MLYRRSALALPLLVTVLATVGGRAATVELLPGPVILAGETFRLQWTGDSVRRVDLIATDADGQRTQWPPAAVGGTAWTLPELGPGTFHLTAAVHDAAGQTLGQGEWRVAVIDPPHADSSAVARRLPKLAAALRGGQARLQVIAAQPAAVRPTLGVILRQLLPAWLGGTLTELDPPAAPDPRRFDPGRLEAGLTATPAELVVLDLATCCAGLPPRVLAHRAAAVVASIGRTGGDAVVLTPPPRGASAGELAAALECGRLVAEELGERAVVVDGAAALWPAAYDLQRFEEALRKWIGPGGEWTAEGHRRLAEAVLRALAGTPAAAAEVAVTGSLRRAGLGAEVKLSFTNRVATPQRVCFEALCPPGLTPAGGLLIDLLAGESRTVTRPVALPEPARLALDPLLQTAYGGEGRVQAALFVQSAWRSWPLRLTLREDDLDAAFLPGRLVASAATATVLLRNGSREPRRGRLVGPPGSADVAWSLPGNGRDRMVVPLLLPATPAGRAPALVQAESGASRAIAAAPVRFVRAAVANAGEVTVDGVLEEWRQDTWHLLGAAEQVIAGQEQWSGASDSALRWSARVTDSGLALAAIIRDDTLTASDRLVILLDPRPAATLGTPGLPTRFELDLTDPVATPNLVGQVGVQWPTDPDDEVLEWLLPWENLGGRRQPGDLLGWDLLLSDTDDEDPPTQLSATGEPWAHLDPSRLGLLRLHQTTGPLPLRLLFGWE